MYRQGKNGAAACKAAECGVPIISAGFTSPMGFWFGGGFPITDQVCRFCRPGGESYRFYSAPMAPTGLPPSVHFSSLCQASLFFPSRHRLSLSGLLSTRCPPPFRRISLQSTRSLLPRLLLSRTAHALKNSTSDYVGNARFKSKHAPHDSNRHTPSAN